MRRLFLFALTIILSLTLFGCGGNSCLKLTDMKEGNGSLVYGYIDFGDAAKNMAWVNMYQAKPKSEKPYWYACWNKKVKKGMFWFTNLPNGSYRLFRFAADDKIFSFPQFGPGHKLRIKKPGVYYVGSYKITGINKAGFFSMKADTVDIELIKHPGAKELLKTLQPLGAGTKWEAIIKKKLRRMK